MSWLQVSITFLVVWWLVLFMVLPFGARPEDRPQLGHAESAPARPRLILKSLVTTAIAILLTCGIYLALSSGLVGLSPTP